MPILSHSFTLPHAQIQWSVMHTKLVLFILTFIQQKKKKRNENKHEIHYVASTCSLIRWNEPTLGYVSIYMCVSNDIVRDNRTGS